MRHVIYTIFSVYNILKSLPIMDSQVGDGHQSQTSEVDTPNFASDGYEHEPRSITLIFCELMHVFF